MCLVRGKELAFELLSKEWGKIPHEGWKGGTGPEQNIQVSEAGKGTGNLSGAQQSLVFLGALDMQGILREAAEARASAALKDSVRRQV